MTDFDSLFGDAELEMKCPKCNTKFPFKIKDVGKTIACPNCSAKIHLDKTDSFNKSEQDVNKSLEDLRNTFKNLGK